MHLFATVLCPILHTISHYYSVSISITNWAFYWKFQNTKMKGDQPEIENRIEKCNRNERYEINEMDVYIVEQGKSVRSSFLYYLIMRIIRSFNKSWMKYLLPNNVWIINMLFPHWSDYIVFEQSNISLRLLW